jgi:phosphoglycolate phosphatase-like HAD superfamily hydrolase
MKKTQRLLIFDFDGTIADTFQQIVKISNHLAKEFDFHTIHSDEIESLKDKTSQEITRYLNVPILKIPLIVAKAKQHLFKDINLTQPREGLKDVLHKLKHNGMRIGILTSNSCENVSKFLQAHELDIFDFIASTSRIWGKSKRLNELISQEGFHTHETLYIGDETRDIEAARKAGICVAAVSWGYNSSKALSSHKPDYLIHSPHELFEICANHTPSDYASS